VERHIYACFALLLALGSQEDLQQPCSAMQCSAMPCTAKHPCSGGQRAASRSVLGALHALAAAEAALAEARERLATAERGLAGMAAAGAQYKQYVSGGVARASTADVPEC
jgi:hypothetical protein